MRIRFAGWFASPRLLVAALLLVPSLAWGQVPPSLPGGPPAPEAPVQPADRDDEGPRDRGGRRGERSDDDRARDRAPERRERPRPVLDTMFRRLDASQDGELEAAEIPSDRKQLFRRLVAGADQNSDRKLNREEFDTGMKRLADQFTNRFRMAAQGPDDRAQREGEGRGDRPGRPAAGLFGALDRDGDGQIANEEMEYATRSLKRLDRDGNGNLTPDEAGSGGPPRRMRPASDRDDGNRDDERRGDRDGNRGGPDGPPAFEPGGPGNPGGPGGGGGFGPRGPGRGGEGGPRGGFPGGIGRPGFGPPNPDGGPFGFGGGGTRPADDEGIPPAVLEFFDRLDSNHDGQVGREELRELFRLRRPGNRPEGGRPPGPGGPRTGGRPGAVEV